MGHPELAAEVTKVSQTALDRGDFHECIPQLLNCTENRPSGRYFEPYRDFWLISVFFFRSWGVLPA
jgi:hypothetical protein